MIQDQKPSLYTCAFGVGAVHVLALAAILPVMITLPSPDDPASGTVAVPVAIRTALPAPFVSTAMTDPGAFSEVLMYGEGDVDEVVLPAAVPIAARGPDLPARSASTEPVPLIKQAALSSAIEAEAAVTIAPVLAREVTYPEDIEVNILARLPDFMPDTVPRPLSKPDLSTVRRAPAAKRSPPAKKKARRKPAPSGPRVTKARPKAAPKPGFGGFFGGGAARTMKEFPLPASR